RGAPHRRARLAGQHAAVDPDALRDGVRGASLLSGTSNQAPHPDRVRGFLCAIVEDFVAAAFRARRQPLRSPFHNPHDKTGGTFPMAISLYSGFVPVCLQLLTGLKTVLQKCEAHTTEQKWDPAVVLNLRLYPD